MEFYKSDLKLKKDLHIIEDLPLYPIIYDRNRTMLSLPPIINKAHLAISWKTKNMFIKCTATDLTKLCRLSTYFCLQNCSSTLKVQLLHLKVQALLLPH
ncbi:putative phenylalanine--tRNA ligase [Helianthus annuus]|nr:putative phenylalanine--tRNA ligase [Helianthus annuus]